MLRNARKVKAAISLTKNNNTSACCLLEKKSNLHPTTPCSISNQRRSYSSATTVPFEQAFSTVLHYTNLSKKNKDDSIIENLQTLVSHYKGAKQGLLPEISFLIEDVFKNTQQHEQKEVVFAIWQEYLQHLSVNDNNAQELQRITTYFLRQLSFHFSKEKHDTQKAFEYFQQLSPIKKALPAFKAIMGLKAAVVGQEHAGSVEYWQEKVMMYLKNTVTVTTLLPNSTSTRYHYHFGEAQYKELTGMMRDMTAGHGVQPTAPFVTQVLAAAAPLWTAWSNSSTITHVIDKTLLLRLVYEDIYVNLRVNQMIQAEDQEPLKKLLLNHLVNGLSHLSRMISKELQSHPTVTATATATATSPRQKTRSSSSNGSSTNSALSKLKEAALSSISSASASVESKELQLYRRVLLAVESLIAQVSHDDQSNILHILTYFRVTNNHKMVQKLVNRMLDRNEHSKFKALLTHFIEDNDKESLEQFLSRVLIVSEQDVTRHKLDTEKFILDICGKFHLQLRGTTSAAINSLEEEFYTFFRNNVLPYLSGYDFDKDPFVNQVFGKVFLVLKETTNHELFELLQNDLMVTGLQGQCARNTELLANMVNLSLHFNMLDNAMTWFQMLKDNCHQSTTTLPLHVYLSFLKYFANLDNHNEVTMFEKLIFQHYFNTTTDKAALVQFLSYMIQVYCKRGNINDAIKVINYLQNDASLPLQRRPMSLLDLIQDNQSDNQEVNHESRLRPTVVTYSVIIDQLLKVGSSKSYHKALHVLEDMRSRGTEGNHYTFVSFASYYINKGQLENAIKLFKNPFTVFGKNAKEAAAASLLSISSSGGDGDMAQEDAAAAAMTAAAQQQQHLAQTHYQLIPVYQYLVYSLCKQERVSDAISLVNLTGVNTLNTYACIIGALCKEGNHLTAFKYVSKLNDSWDEVMEVFAASASSYTDQYYTKKRLVPHLVDPARDGSLQRKTIVAEPNTPLESKGEVLQLVLQQEKTTLLLILQQLKKEMKKPAQTELIDSFITKKLQPDELNN